ncbi:hypothetical protein HDV00_006714, partial [Rhizophlyctis rosea]
MEDLITTCCKSGLTHDRFVRLPATPIVPLHLFTPILHQIPDDLDKLKLVLHWSGGVTEDLRDQIKLILCPDQWTPSASLTSAAVLPLLDEYANSKNVVPMSIINAAMRYDVEYNRILAKQVADMRIQIDKAALEQQAANLKKTIGKDMIQKSVIEDMFQELHART